MVRVQQRPETAQLILRFTGAIIIGWTDKTVMGPDGALCPAVLFACQTQRQHSGNSSLSGPVVLETWQTIFILRRVGLNALPG
ncbi:hypothetical protein BaRGS_00028337 [Batillaria attramentaria]|uniref:Uncharacterized protein n=1 Tax=Batillaria attramentaria TaxID=370345 RepID=A0ABD0K0S8_9CAEN